MRDDKDHKGNRQHLECICSCADTKHPSGNRYQEHQPCKQIEYDGRELREEDTDPLYQAGRKILCKRFSTKSRMALESRADSGLNPLITESHGGQNGMRVGTA